VACRRKEHNIRPKPLWNLKLSRGRKRELEWFEMEIVEHPSLRKTEKGFESNSERKERIGMISMV
jgi:hypothetical protein